MKMDFKNFNRLYMEHIGMPPDPSMCINNKDLKLWRILLVRLCQMSSEIAINSRIGPAQYLEVDMDSYVWEDLIANIDNTNKSIKIIDNKELEHNEAFLYRQITESEIEYAYKGKSSWFDIRNSGRRLVFETL
jgi:hypothetical protein